MKRPRPTRGQAGVQCLGATFMPRTRRESLVPLLSFASVLPKGFHRIRHYGLFASTCRAENIAHARELLATAAPTIETAPGNAEADTCPCCGGRMLIIETFERGSRPHYRSSPPITIRIDTS
jgi:hypothetical protein